MNHIDISLELDFSQREQEYLKQLNSKLSKEKDQLELLSSSRVVKANNDTEINDELKGKIEAQERKVRELEEELEALKKTKSHEKELQKSQGKDEVSNLEQRPLSKTTRSLIPTPPTSAGKRTGYTNRFRRTISASGYGNVYFCFFPSRDNISGILD